MNLRTFTRVIIFILTLGTLSSVVSAEEAESFKGDLHDAWLQGKVETVLLLNRHLNNFSIDSHVQNGVVELSGTVASTVERDLAVELARGIEGVEKVEDNLQISDKPTVAEKAVDRIATNRAKFSRWVDDVTTTAAVKSRLLGNANTKGLSINVDTQNDVVTLTGSVESDQVRQLAGEIAANTGDVSSVKNRIEVVASNN